MIILTLAVNISKLLTDKIFLMIANIQYLRFLAAFLVIYAHANLAVYGITPQITNLGGVGVDIFFIISGFIMPYIIYGGLYKDGMVPKLTPVGFIKRRITRIWPLFAAYGDFSFIYHLDR